MQPVSLRKFTHLLILLALLAGGCATAQATEEPTPTPMPTPVIPNKPTYTVQRGEVVRNMVFTGRVVPVLETEMYFAVNGRVDNVYVKEGDKVTAGQLLADLDTGGSAYDLRRAEINLEMAKLRLEQTRKNTPTWSDNYETVVKMAEYEVELAQISLDELNAYLDAARIVCMADGTVRNIGIREGNTVEAFKPVIMVADLSQVEISVELSPDQMALIQEGMTGTAAPVGDPSKTVEAVIRAMPYPFGTTSEEDAQKVTSTRITFETVGRSGLVLGDLAQVTLALEKRTDTLWLPPQAIRLFNGRTFVVVKDADGQQRRVDVKVGIEGDDRVEILEGVTEGQIVLAP